MGFHIRKPNTKVANYLTKNAYELKTSNPSIAQHTLASKPHFSSLISIGFVLSICVAFIGLTIPTKSFGVIGTFTSNNIDSKGKDQSSPTKVEFIVDGFNTSMGQIPLNKIVSLKISAVDKKNSQGIDKPKIENNKNAQLSDKKLTPVKSVTEKTLPIEIVEFDAQMPEHNHGMVVIPKVTKTGANEWRVDGVKLHMRGHWELALKVKIADREETMLVSLDL